MESVLGNGEYFGWHQLATLDFFKFLAIYQRLIEALANINIGTLS
jgi:hypothetical protein